MGRALGWEAQLLFAFEAVKGTAPVTGAYWRLPFTSLDVGGEQPLVADDVLGLGRDPQAPTKDLLRDGGQITVPVDVRNIGNWLKLAYDLDNTSAGPPYTHTFLSGVTALLSATIEIGFPEVSAYYLNTGVEVQSIQFSVQRSGKLVAVIQVMGQNEVQDTSPIDATPNELTYNRFDTFEGNIQRNGSDLALVLSGDQTFSNNLDPVETIRDDALIEGFDPGVCSLGGTINTRFGDTTLWDDAHAGAAIDLDFIYTIDASNKLTLSAHEIYLPKPKRNVSGPGGVEVSYAWQGATNVAAGEMQEVLLINDVATYINAV